MFVDKPINGDIKEPKLLVIYTLKNTKGEVETKKEMLETTKALELSRKLKLDLVLITPSNGKNMAVAKILDYKKFVYDSKKNDKNSKQSGSGKLKELKITPHITDHDIEWRSKQIADWIKNGNQVKLKINTYGRIAFKQDVIDKIANIFNEKLAKVARVLTPLKKMSDKLQEITYIPLR